MRTNRCVVGGTTVAGEEMHDEQELFEQLDGRQCFGFGVLWPLDHSRKRSFPDDESTPGPKPLPSLGLDMDIF